MIPTLSTVCSLPHALDETLREYAAGQCRSVELWLPTLEAWIEQHSDQVFHELLAEQQMTAAVASYQGGLLITQGEARRKAWDLFSRRLAICGRLNIGTIIVALDVPAPIAQQDVDRATASLTQLATTVGQHQMRVALEFQSRSAFGNNLQTAAALVADVGSPHLGLCLDAFHFYTGPSKTEDLGYFGPHNLFHVQVCDLLDAPREFATDSQRILPGDGDIFLEPIVERLKAIGYAGCVSLETMNPQLWQIPPRQFGEIAITSLRKLLGQAAMD